MSETHKPYDTSTKSLIDADPLAWVHFLGLPGESAELFDTNLVTVLSDADRVLKVSHPDYLALLEMLSGYDPDAPERVLMYRSILRSKKQMRVKCVILLLREQADGSAMSGLLVDDEVSFQYTVIRLWELPTDAILAAPRALLPLAPLTNVSAAELPAVVRQMEARINAEATAAERSNLWTATGLLLGMKYEKDFIQRLLEGAMFNLRDSSVYQAAIEEGRAQARIESLRSSILRLGNRRFGIADQQTQNTLETIISVEHLEELELRLLEVESWDELLERQ